MTEIHFGLILATGAYTIIQVALPNCVVSVHVWEYIYSPLIVAIRFTFQPRARRPSHHDDQRWHGIPSRLRMRDIPLRFVHCRCRRNELIVHSSLGCYTILFALAIYLKLSGPDHLRGVNRPLFIITVFLYLCCSAHFFLGFIHFYITLVCALSYSGYAFSENYSRIPQALMDTQT